MKIVIYGQAKSGTTTLNFRVKEAMEAQPGVGKVANIFEAIAREPDGDGFRYRMKSGSQIREKQDTLVKTLLPSGKDLGVKAEAALETFSDFDRKIYIQRDPRDRWVSGFFYKWFHGHNPDADAFARALRLTQHKEKHPNDLPFYALLTTDPDLVARWIEKEHARCEHVLSFVNDARAAGWHILRYEDLVDDKVSALNAYLGFEISATRDVGAEFKRVARSLGYGDWRRWFTSDDVPVFRAMYSDLLEGLGYDIEDWALDDVTSLPSDQGSGYMAKLFKGDKKRGLSGK
ncbi:MAG: hypothetical protein AAF581_20790 [Planctomycetota bacterium]